MQVIFMCSSPALAKAQDDSERRRGHRNAASQHRKLLEPMVEAAGMGYSHESARRHVPRQAETGGRRRAVSETTSRICTVGAAASERKLFRTARLTYHYANHGKVIEKLLSKVILPVYSKSKKTLVKNADATPITDCWNGPAGGSCDDCGGLRYAVSTYSKLVGFSGDSLRDFLSFFCFWVFRARSVDGGARVGFHSLLSFIFVAGARGGRCEIVGGGGCDYRPGKLFLDLFVDRDIGRSNCHGDSVASGAGSKNVV